jgi:hypothetical protein
MAIRQNHKVHARLCELILRQKPPNAIEHEHLDVEGDTSLDYAHVAIFSNKELDIDVENNVEEVDNEVELEVHDEEDNQRSRRFHYQLCLQKHLGPTSFHIQTKV